MKKKLIILISFISILILTAGGVFAYFMATSSNNEKLSVNINKDTVTAVSTYGELYAAVKDSTYNNDESVSATSRKIVRFSNDITLDNSLLVTADVLLDLHGYTLNLNDHTLKFKHGYYGALLIEGPTETESYIRLGENNEGRIEIDTINASYVFNNVTFQSYNSTTSEYEDLTNHTSYVDVVNMDEKYTYYSALYLVANAIDSDIANKLEYETFATVSASDYEIDATKFILEKNVCTNNSNNVDTCSYVYKDLDLPFNYLSSDISISYSSSNTAIVSNYGNVNPTSGATVDVTLTVTVSFGTTWTNSCEFKLHVVDITNSTIKNNIAETLIRAYLQEYYVGTDLVVNEAILLEDYYYSFKHGIELPLSALGGELTFTYGNKNLAGNIVNTYSYSENGVWVFEPSEECYYLLVYVNGGSTPIELQMYSTYVGNQETVARLILNKLYGGSIVYDKAKSSITLSQLSDIDDSYIEELITQYNITNLTYQLSTASSSTASTYYSLDGYTLSKSVVNTPETKVSAMTCIFTFGSGATATTVSVDLYIYFMEGNGDTLSSFLAYYNIYNPQVSSSLNTSFTMPFAYQTNYPYTCYDFAYNYETTTNYSLDSDNHYTYTIGKPAGLDMTLVYDNNGTVTTLHKFTGDGTTTFVTELSSYVSSSGYSLAQLASMDAYYIISVDSQTINPSDTDVLLIYNYYFNSTDGWNVYKSTETDEEGNILGTYLTELTTTEFVLEGGLFYNSSSSSPNAVKDSSLFVWIYNNFNPDITSDSDKITTSSSLSTILIVNDWLTADVAVDVTADTTLSSVSDFSGIGYLTGTTTVNLSGKNMSSYVSSLVNLKSVKTLNLSGCSITDASTLASMDTVKILDISNNSLTSFAYLLEMDSLEKVYLYNNTASSEYLGSTGICNYQTFIDLMRKGISVYNTSSTVNSVVTPILYTETNDLNDYVRFKTVEYQSALSTSISIVDLYNPTFSGLSVSNWNLENTGGTLSWSYGGGNDVYDATYFQVNYTFTVSSVTYTLNVKYYVDRY